MAAHKTLHWHGVSSPAQSLTYPSSMHDSRAHTHALSDSRSLPPSLSCGLLACASRHLCCAACRSLARASSRSTWCVPVTGLAVTGVLVHYVWRSNGTDVLSHVHSLAKRAQEPVALRWLRFVLPDRRKTREWHSSGSACVSSWYACCCCVWLQPTASAIGGTQCMLHHGTESARSFARGTLWLWTLRCCSVTCVSLHARGVV